VAKERLKSPRARLFVALDLPEAIRDALAAWQREALAAEELRPANPQTLHMTLAFLGYRPEREMDRIASVATDVTAAAPEVRLLPDPVPVPKGRPRLFAIDAESEDAIALQAEVEAKLVEAGFYEPEERDFWPHLTVARVRSERRAPEERGKGGKRRRWGRPMRVHDPPGPLPDALLEPFRAVRVALYRSHLRPTGAEYAPVATVELPIAGSGKAS
jgi:RNA 2',3'-cyclic 3'-phosphodiesterase